MDCMQKIFTNGRAGYTCNISLSDSRVSSLTSPLLKLAHEPPVMGSGWVSCSWHEKRGLCPSGLPKGMTQSKRLPSPLSHPRAWWAVRYTFYIIIWWVCFTKDNIALPSTGIFKHILWRITDFCLWTNKLTLYPINWTRTHSLKTFAIFLQRKAKKGPFPLFPPSY